MNIIVCIKQVPDTNDIKIDPVTNTLIREGVASILNPFDTYAVEEAVRLKETHGGKVTAITMGPPQAESVLKEAISLGVDEIILLSDRKFAGADTWATSNTLAAAVRKIADYDLVLFGQQAIDGDTAQVGPQTAEKLNYSQVTYVEEIQKIENNIARIKRKIDGGQEIVEAQLPLLMTVIKGKQKPRPFSAKKIMKYKSSKTLLDLEKMCNENSLLYLDELVLEYKDKNLYIETLSTNELLSIDESRLGLHGSPTKVHKVESVILSGGEATRIEPTKEGIGLLIDELLNDHILG